MVEPATLSRFIAIVDRNRQTIKSCRLRCYARFPVAQNGVSASVRSEGKSRLRVISSVFLRSPATNQQLEVLRTGTQILSVTLKGKFNLILSFC